ncbi:uncharacterized protein MONBRDRAFT_30309 [Monosiga brevicollis MX1]|uniref:Uncharacterized protein n=1 Tax=Monosiga brevicollis TaxID=81824 RepID=A9VDL4_MONBE|nr:uncharacterized protein MONBRDRAFT_30309 [Monosiga brevicollis MX1]EDQ84415.1 predicted protein [Monosiga brevicollis MX1]|eukprot:XP_001750816.1 hypothetical protein [Monosiga brevicollis MX1]
MPLLISSYLDIQDLGRAAQVCRQFARARWLKVDLRPVYDKVSSATLTYVLTQKQPSILVVPRPHNRLVPAAPFDQFFGRELTLSNVQVANAHLLALVRSTSSNLSVLRLSNCYLSPANARYIVRLMLACPDLRELDLSENGFNAAVMRYFAETDCWSALRRLDISHMKMERLDAAAVATWLLRCPWLEELHLASTQLHDDDLMALLPVIAQLKYLRHLNLGDNCLTAHGIAELCNTIKHMTIETLDLQCNELGAAALQPLMLHLKTGRPSAKAHGYLHAGSQPAATLKRLILWDNRMGNAGAIALAQALACSLTLEEVDARFNHISVGGARALAEALERNTTLRKLGLRHNPLQDAGAVSFASTLRLNSTLRELDLEEVGMSYIGVESLARALRANHSLRCLCLRNNNIGDTLDLSQLYHATEHAVSEQALRDFASALANNHTLRRVALIGMAPSPAVARYFHNELAQRVQLEKTAKGQLIRVQSSLLHTMWIATLLCRDISLTLTLMELIYMSETRVIISSWILAREA